MGIARAIVAHTNIVVADEPTGSLDAETSEQVQFLLQRLNRELGITMLMITHDSDVASIATRKLMLENAGFPTNQRFSQGEMASLLTLDGCLGW